jgi:hypothetical protein
MDDVWGCESPFWAVMFHATGLKRMESRDTSSDVCEKSTRDSTDTMVAGATTAVHCHTGRLGQPGTAELWSGFLAVFWHQVVRRTPLSTYSLLTENAFDAFETAT